MMPHHLFSVLLKKAFAELLQERGVQETVPDEGRRKFLRDAALLGGGLTLAPSLIHSGSVAKKPASGSHIAIIGAGIAGLNACYQLKKAGIHSTIYERSDRVGGRMFTKRNLFGEGITTDIGGEFVDSAHADIIQLVGELGLSFYDLRKDPLDPKELYFGGRHIPNAELKTALAPFLGRLVEDVKSLPEKINYQTADQFRQLDNLSITEYIRGLGIGGWLYDFIDLVLTREYGMEASEQSAVNFLIMFQPPVKEGSYYELFGDDHEVFKIKGGSQRLTDALEDRLSGQIRLNHRLSGIKKDSGTGYRLAFEKAGTILDIPADYVLITLPFSILRNIPLDVDLPEGKRKCIDEIGYGNSCKFILGMQDKPWRKSGRQGYTFTDLSFGAGWDSSQSQTGGGASFTIFGGGRFGAEMARRKESESIADFIPALETIYPGSQKAFTGKSIRFCWEKNPMSQAGYSSFKKGQWSSLAGWEALPVGNLFFAGEHVSGEFQGYMNGGAQTGRVAASLIAEKIRKVQSS